MSNDSASHIEAHCRIFYYVTIYHAYDVTYGNMTSSSSVLYISVYIKQKGRILCKMTIDTQGRVALMYKRLSSKCSDTDDVTVQRAYV